MNEAIADANKAELTAYREMAAVKKRRRGGISKRLDKIAQSALDCLDEILNDGDAKAADRISAAKLTFDILKQQDARTAGQDEDGGMIKVVFEGIPEEHTG